LAWIILEARRFKLVQIKCPGVRIAPAMGLNFYKVYVIYREVLKKILLKNFYTKSDNI